ncbi:MAG: hypothetical protein AVDCRST_MAG77-5191 [uncultured Chloroflexi bacterium]|uniref:GH16 domain-containing protein n=1 Tax=uncultured Chloroflexota bacterium TaxID=166587 RepID=A0A6J4JZJ8_9CHLR|nr:MAG: hypothetical protein AVDCRST_MAG77-5191 [uncultured Chloroflexota bacterium]
MIASASWVAATHRRRAALRAALTVVPTAGIACAAPRHAGALWPAPPPRDSAAVFQDLLPGRQVAPLGAPDSPWHIFVESPSRVMLDGNGLVLESVPGRRIWASPRLPVAPLEAVLPSQVEELTWTATVRVEPPRRFFVLCELRFAAEPGAILIQPTPFDLQITQDPERPGGGSSDSLSRIVADGREHYWRLRLDATRAELRLNGSVIWSVEGRHALSRITFGETRTDAFHGGRLLLRDLVYVRRPIPATERY